MALSEAVKYVAAAYIFVFVLMLVYLAIMAARLRRIQREMKQLDVMAEAGTGSEASTGGSSVADAGRDEPFEDEPDALDVGRPESSVA